MQEGKEQHDDVIRSDSWTDRVFCWRGCLLLICLYRLLLDYDFLYVCEANTRRIAYAWNIANETTGSFLISWTMLLVSFPFVVLWLKQRREVFSHIVMVSIYLLSFVPLTTCARGGTINCDCLVWIAAYFFLLFTVYSLLMQVGFHSVCFFARIRRLFVSIKESNREKIAVMCAVLMMATVVYISYRYTGFRLNFDLSNIYDLRLEARKYPLTFLTKFVFSWSKNLLPLLFGYFLFKKWFVFTSIAFCVQFLSFSIDGSKYTLIAPFVVALFALPCLRYGEGRFPFLVGGGLIVLLLLDVVTSGQVSLFNGHFVQRLILTPTHLHEWYYQFFWGREADFFRTNLRHFGVDGPYTAVGGVARAIGDFYGRPAMHANNGLFSDAISNFGIPWLLLMPIAVVLVLRFFDFCTKGLEPRLIAIMAIQMSLGLISSPLVSLLLAGGLAFFPFFALLMKRDKAQD